MNREWAGSVGGRQGGPYLAGDINYCFRGESLPSPLMKSVGLLKWP